MHKEIINLLLSRRNLNIRSRNPLSNLEKEFDISILHATKFIVVTGNGDRRGWFVNP